MNLENFPYDTDDIEVSLWCAESKTFEGKTNVNLKSDYRYTIPSLSACIVFSPNASMSSSVSSLNIGRNQPCSHALLSIASFYNTEVEVYNPDEQMHDWQIVAVSREYGHHDHCQDVIELAIKVRRNSASYIWKIILPLVILSAVNCMGFFIPSAMIDSILSFSITILLSTLALLYVKAWHLKALNVTGSFSPFAVAVDTARFCVPLTALWLRAAIVCTGTSCPAIFRRRRNRPRWTSSFTPACCWSSRPRSTSRCCSAVSSA